MAQFVWIRELSVDDIDDVVAVERQCYPREIRDSRVVMLERLKDTESVSLNLGLFNREKLVGYILAHWNDTADIDHWETEDIIYVDDLAVLPRQRRYVYRLLKYFVREIRNAYPDLPVVANALKSVAPTWTGHEALSRSLGYELSRVEESRERATGEPICLIKWMPVSGASQSGPANHQKKRSLTDVTTRAGKTFQTWVAETEEDLLALQDDWECSQAISPGLTVFQTHAYQTVWWRHFGMSRQLFVVCIYDKGALIGIAPFMISRCKVYWKNFREVNFIGTRWEVDRPGFLFTGSSEECGEVAAKVLIAYRRRWDLMKFHEQDTDNPALAAFLDELGRQGILLGTTIDSVCPHLKLQGTWADFLAAKSQKFRKNLKAARRKLERAGRLEYGRFSGDSGRLHGLLKEYETLELSSRKAKAGVRVVSNPEYLDFYRDIVEKFSDSGQFIFRSLRLDGQLIAATFGLEFQRVYYSLQISHDDAFSQFSPGSLLESIELEECFAADLNEYDFLGGFLNNKRRWTTTARKTKQVYGYRPLFNFRLIYLVYFQVKPTLKNWLGRVGVGFHGRTQGTSQ